jgi:hypothetical protein
MNHQEIEELAYQLWQERGCPEGSPDEDWFRAEEELRAAGTTPLSVAVSAAE